MNVDKNTSKLSAWLEIDSLVDLKLKQDGLELIGLLAFEIVREVMTFGLIISQLNANDVS